MITTPNADYNKLWPSLPAGKFRHADHRFEWGREEFKRWAGSVSEKYGYSVSCHPVGDEDPACGAPTQMAVFDR